MASHAKCSPSASSRWLQCTAAPTMEAQYPEEITSYAIEGTIAHEMAEAYAKKATSPKFPTFERKRANIASSDRYDPEMELHAKAYAEFVKTKLEEVKQYAPDAFVELEVRLNLKPWVPQAFGTADCVIISDYVLTVIDYKYGKGVKVSAEENSQMKLYALGAYRKYEPLYEIKEVEMVIFQPRLSSCESWKCSVKDLLEWGETVVKPKAAEAFKGPGTFCPSEQACRFCKAKGDCRARAEAIVSAFDENPPELLPTLTKDEIGALLDKAKDMKAWLADLEAKAFSLLAQGEEVKGWKIVEGRSNRKYIDEKKVATALLAEGFTEEEIFTKKLITITAVEKLLGKKETAAALEGLIEKPKGSPTLAPLTDKRPAMALEDAILNAFDE